MPDDEMVRTVNSHRPLARRYTPPKASGTPLPLLFPILYLCVCCNTHKKD